MNKTIKLTDSEWKIMQALWDSSPKTLREIIDAVQPDTQWSKHTVISFLKRMAQKGSITVEESHPAKRYFAAVDEQSVITQETDYMLKKLYGGSPGLLVSNMADSLGTQEIDELIAILQEAKEGNNK